MKTYLHAKADALARMGIRHAIVVPGDRTAVEHLGATRLYRVQGPRLAMSRAYRVMLSSAPLRDVIDAEQPDVIEVGSPFIVPHLVYRASAGRHPTVGFYHADVVRTFAEPYVPNRLAAPLRVIARNLARRMVRSIYRRFDVTVAASQSVAEELRALGVPDVRVIGLGVDLVTFRPTPPEHRLAPEALGAEPGVPIGIYVGRFCAEKRLDVVLEGHARIPAHRRPHLALVGGGPHAARLAEHARREPRVSVLPYVSDRDTLARLYGSADFYLASGPGETFGLAIAEAMACGLPVVAVRRGAAPDRVAGSGVGELYEHGDPDSAARALEVICARLEPEMGRRARMHAERTFDWSDTFTDLAALYREVAAVHRA
ncbi:MAG: glycosyltransferase [Gemmatimonadota bacterium]